MKQEFPEVKGKIVDIVELSVEPDFYGVTIRFQDSTSLTFDIEPCVVASPIFAKWKDGEEKRLKEYHPVRSEILLMGSETEARPKDS